MATNQHANSILRAELIELDDRLVNHFSKLKTSVKKQNRQTPLFLLEHGMNEEEITHLKMTVRKIIEQGQLHLVEVRHWLVFAVYTTEFGYSYDGHEYWPSFTKETPGWSQKVDNEKVRTWGMKFASQYNGVTPIGKFAKQFGIISWAIANAIIPRVHQHQLIEIISKIQNQLSLHHLKSPESLGKLVAKNVPDQAEQLKLFCTNHQLIGEIVFSLLTHNIDTSGYLEDHAVARIVSSLSAHTETRRLLQYAQRTAERIIPHGFLPKTRSTPPKTVTPVQPPPTHPTLLKLEKRSDKWCLRAELRPLRELNPQLAKDLQDKHDAKVYLAGVDRRGIKLSTIIKSGIGFDLHNLPDTVLEPIVRSTLDSNTTAILQSVYRMTLEHPLVFKAMSNRTADMIRSRGANPSYTYFALVDRIDFGLPRTFGTIVKTSLPHCNCLRFKLSENPSPHEARTLFTLKLFLRTEIIIGANTDGNTIWDGRGTASTKPDTVVTFNLSGLPNDARLLVGPPVQEALETNIEITIHSQSRFTVKPKCRGVFYLPINMRRAGTDTQELIGLIRINTTSCDAPSWSASSKPPTQPQEVIFLPSLVDAPAIQGSMNYNLFSGVKLVIDARTTTALLSREGTYLVAQAPRTAILNLHHSAESSHGQPIASLRISSLLDGRITSRHIAELVVASKIIHRTPIGIATISITVGDKVLARHTIADDLPPAIAILNEDLSAVLKSTTEHRPVHFRRDVLYFSSGEPYTPILLPTWLNESHPILAGVAEFRKNDGGVSRTIFPRQHAVSRTVMHEINLGKLPPQDGISVLKNLIHAFKTWYLAGTENDPERMSVRSRALDMIMARIAHFMTPAIWDRIWAKSDPNDYVLRDYLGEIGKLCVDRTYSVVYAHALSQNKIALALIPTSD